MKEIRVNLSGLHRGQRTIMEHRRRFNVVICGRRFGKTDLAKNLICTALLHGKRVALMSPVFKDIKDVWDSVVQTLQKVANKKDETLHILWLPTGGRFVCYSLSDKGQMDNSRGEDFDVVIYDETQKINSDILKHNYMKAVSPTLLKTRGECWFLGTPPDSRMHYFYELFCLGALNNKRLLTAIDVQISKEIREIADDDFISFRAPSSTNPLLHEDEIARFKRQLPKFVFEQEVLAMFVESSGQMFFQCLQDSSLQARLFSGTNLLRKGWDTAITFDFNNNPMAAILVQYNQRFEAIHFVKEFGAIGAGKVNIEYTCSQIKQYIYEQYNIKIGTWGKASYPCPRGMLNLKITGDATGRSVSGQQAENLNYYEYIQRSLGLDNDAFVVPSVNLTHPVRFMQMNTYLELHPKIFIDAELCPRLKTDLLGAIMNNTRHIEKKKFDPHYADAFCYYFQAFFPVQYTAH